MDRLIQIPLLLLSLALSFAMYAHDAPFYSWLIVFGAFAFFVWLAIPNFIRWSERIAHWREARQVRRTERFYARRFGG